MSGTSDFQASEVLKINLHYVQLLKVNMCQHSYWIQMGGSIVSLCECFLPNRAVTFK